MTTIESSVIYDPARYATEGPPLEEFARLRAEAPVSKIADHEQPNGLWAVTRYADVVHVSRHPEVFSSHRQTSLLNEMPDAEQLTQQQMMMVNQDAPEHTRLRSLVNRGFTPRMIGKLTDKITAACTRIVDEAVAAGEGDFVTLCAAELPLVVIADLIGVPYEDRHKLFDWTNRMISSADPDGPGQEDARAASIELITYAYELGTQHKLNPTDDIITKLVSPDDNGQELSDLEFALFFMLLSVAGNETTRNSISGGTLALIEHPDQWARLKADPAGMAGTTAEEVVRWVTPVNAFRRTTTEDTELGGVAIPEGEKVVIFYSSANRDAAAFDQPDVFDVGRTPNEHVGFGGGGPHFCLGRHLARLEIEIMFRTLAEKIDHVELTGPIRRLHSNFLNGITNMPVRLVPAG